MKLETEEKKIYIDDDDDEVLEMMNVLVLRKSIEPDSVTEWNLRKCEQQQPADCQKFCKGRNVGKD